MGSLKAGGLLTQVNYKEKMYFWGSERQSLNTDRLKERFDCTSYDAESSAHSIKWLFL